MIRRFMGGGVEGTGSERVDDEDNNNNNNKNKDEVVYHDEDEDDEERISFLNNADSTPITTKSSDDEEEVHQSSLSSSSSSSPSSLHKNNNNKNNKNNSSNHNDNYYYGQHNVFGDIHEEERRATHSHRLCWSFRVVVMLSTLCIVTTITSCILLLPTTPGSSSHSNNNNNHNNHYHHYTCPTTIQQAQNDRPESFESEYTSFTRNITTNVTEFRDKLHNMSYDGWGRSYNEIKDVFRPFKSTYFSKAGTLQNGSSIYESACGIGLNLYMTLEILAEELGITDLVVYGNEYVPESATKASWILSELTGPQIGNAHIGQICPGDSTNLSFVPSNSMDLVYTGYITPVMDPLHLGSNSHNYTEYKSMCQMIKMQGTPNENLMTGGYDWMGVKLNQIVQQIQEDWYGQWVAQMANIAKPGAPIIIENVSPAYCTKRSDWGGVDREYWNRTATLNTYGWNIDPTSIEIVDNAMFRKRYDIYMLKRK